MCVLGLHLPPSQFRPSLQVPNIYSPPTPTTLFAKLYKKTRHNPALLAPNTDFQRVRLIYLAPILHPDLRAWRKIAGDNRLILCAKYKKNGCI